MKYAVYPGSFDPFTKGHLSILFTSLELFNTVYVVIADNPKKSTHNFSAEERARIINDTLQLYGLSNADIRILPQSEYLADYAIRLGAKFIIRGIRNYSDFESERVLAEFNKNISDDELETIFIPAVKEYSDISSSAVMSLVGYKGWEVIVSELVPAPTFNALTQIHYK